MKKANNLLILLVAVGLSGGFASTAFAQDVSKVKVKKSVSKDTEKEALKRAEERTKVLNKDKTDKEAAAKAIEGPGVDQKAFEDSQQTMTPEQIDALKRKLETKNQQMIKKLSSIIERDPYNKQKPEWMFQKAELVWESANWEYLRQRAKYNQCLDAANKGTVDEKTCQEPKADYTDAQEIYKEILQQYPSYARLDEVIYRLGSGLIEAGQGAQAVSYLQKLVKNYPNSRYLPEAYLALGEFFFEKELLGAARDNYEKVLTYKNNQLYDYALYKYGWVLFNQTEYRKSVDTFKSVVERTGTKIGFQNQAINDLVVVYAEIDDGWKEVRDYLTKKKGKDFSDKKLGQMAGLFEAQGKDDKAVEIFEYFIKDRPNHEKVPQWAESVLIAEKKVTNDDDVKNLEKTMNRFVAYFDTNGTWWSKNKDNEKATNNATLLTDASLSYLSNFFHRRAQKNEDVNDYKKAAGYYQQYIKRFPDSAASFDMGFFLAEILLLNLGEPEKAAQEYQKVVDLYKANNIPKGVKKKDAEAIVKDSAYAIVSAYDELVKKSHPDSILVEMAKYDESKRAKKATDQRAESVDTPPIPKTPLLKYEAKFVAASDQFSELYPKEDVTPTVDFVAAEVYKSRGHYDKCVPRFESIIVNAPKHRYASFAGNSLLEANYRLKRWDEVEKWARYLFDNKIFDVTPKEKLQSAIAYAINERAKDLKNNKEFEKASDELLRLAKEFPKSELAPGALFNAAAIYESGDKVNEALAVYKRVVKEYPESLQAPEALFVMGAIYESQTDFANAADSFSRLGSTEKYKNAKGDEVEYRDHDKAADAVYNAAVILEATEAWDKAIETYEKYAKLWPERENVRDLGIHLAYLEKEKKDPKAAQKRMEDFLKRKDIKPEEKVELYSQIGLLMVEIKGKKWEKNSDEMYTKSVEEWKKLEDEALKKKTRYYASEARFQQAERIYTEFAAVKLGFPLKKLTKTLQEKGKLEQDAEAIYTEIIAMQSPRWVAASAYRIGEMYKNFSDELYNLPIPEGLTQEQQDAYQMALDDNAFPLQEKALTAYRTALKLALQFEAYNEWSSKSAAAISKLESEAYPITGQEGVESTHSQLNFDIPKAVTSLEVVKERVKARKAAKKAAEPKPAPKPAAAPKESAAAK